MKKEDKELLDKAIEELKVAKLDRKKENMEKHINTALYLLKRFKEVIK